VLHDVQLKLVPESVVAGDHCETAKEGQQGVGAQEGGCDRYVVWLARGPVADKYSRLADAWPVCVTAYPS
jgi:hypothetical protein